jgi:hypothetical protein
MRIKLTENFFKDELQCRCGCGIANFNESFLRELQGIRTELGLPMHPTSACRCTPWNEAVGGHPRSLHIGDTVIYQGQSGSLAVDVAAVDGAYRGRLFEVAWRRGWSIGWNARRGFLHLDRRDWIGLKQTSFDY